LRVGLDIDDVVADLLDAWIKEYNRLYDDTKTTDDLDRWNIDECVKPECGKRIYDLVTPSLYLKVIPFYNVMSVVDNIRAMGHEVIYVTHCINGTEAAKLNWLHRWYLLPKEQGYHSGNLISTHDKRHAPVDVLVDDNVKHVENFLGWSVLMNRSHNKSATTNKQRINHLSEFADLLRQRAA
jgi:5'-nucleotidase